MTGTKIKDLESYNRSMSKAMIDKISFYDKVKADLIIDFGCGDGGMIRTLTRLFPEQECVGYDNSMEMVEAAHGNMTREEVDRDRLEFTTDWEIIKDRSNKARSTGKTTCVVLNSVIHEVYAYGAKYADQFWHRIWDLQPDYIAIRDMAVSDSASRPSDALTVARVRQLFPRDLLAQWEAQWGSLEENWSLVHFFLTYRYTKNWDRELRENYLPLSKESLLAKVPSIYQPILSEHYVLPFLRGEVWKDFFIQLQDPTHLKLILRRSNNRPRRIETC